MTNMILKIKRRKIIIALNIFHSVSIPCLELYNEEIRDLAKGSNDDAKHDIVGAKEIKTTVTSIIEKEVKTTVEVRLIQL